eukprot:358318_1
MSSELPSKKRKLNDNAHDIDNCEKKIDYNICKEVLQTCEMVLLTQNENDTKQDVWIDDNAIDIEVKTNSDKYIKQSIEQLQWRKDSYHYFNQNDIELTLRFILVLDSLNFCFWPLQNYEYKHLGLGLKYALENDKTAFDPFKLISLNEITLSKWLLSKFNNGNNNTKIPLIEERVRLLNEIGRILYYEYNNKVENFIKSANGSAIKLVELMTKKFRGFADHCVWPINGKQVFLYKRAQIFVADVYAAYEGKSIGKFNDINELTCFADYRVPQLLRGLNILKYSKRICDIIDKKELIYAGSKDEILIRAGMICAVEKLKHKLNEKRRNEEKNEFISIEIDWCLWNRGEQMHIENKLKPHHRTLTICY